ncbi:DUF5675 family protein [Colwellia sp. Bg11-28]|uniref:DUF5675 family protein n=1 Tax=Colwellia sp. Bg11-28 TaxID=2058305 RepID=UPI000C335C8B|nr:DUF5675 family protein [Colwellia sp. Bg11-28]PKH88325.1 hypothetical protein CXF79_06060 [Colwellia sp. Bg11-28]
MKANLLKAFILVFLTTSMFKVLANPFVIEINRTSHNTSSLTGEMYINGEFMMHTLELPWNNNRSFISSIPPDTYEALLRYDKNDKWRLELKGVPNRSGIQIHIGNWPSQIEGCVLVGNKVKNISNELEGSTVAYKDLKSMFYDSSTPNMSPDLTVKVKISYSPARTSFSGNDLKLHYQDKGRWKLSFEGDYYSFTEKYRDKKYIYLYSKVDDIYLRVPLFGAEKLAEGDSINGNWDVEDLPVVTRLN